MTEKNVTAILIDSMTAAEMLGMSPRKLFDLTKARAIPSRKIDRLVRYSVAEVEAWVDAGCPTEPGAADGVLASMRQGVTS